LRRAGSKDKTTELFQKRERGRAERVRVGRRFYHTRSIIYRVGGWVGGEEREGGGGRARERP